MQFTAELTSITVPLPAGVRCCLLIEADSDEAAIDKAQALGILRHDRCIQLDVFQRDGSAIGRKIWSGLSKVAVAKPSLRVIG